MSKEIPKGTEITGSITKEMDRRFLSSIDLAGHGTVGMTIDRLEKVKELKYLNGQQKENVILLYFKETTRPLEMNATNIKSLIMVTGTNKANDWLGKKIGLYAMEGTFFGKPGLAVRIDHEYKGDK